MKGLPTLDALRTLINEYQVYFKPSLLDLGIDLGNSHGKRPAIKIQLGSLFNIDTIQVKLINLRHQLEFLVHVYLAQSLTSIKRLPDLGIKGGDFARQRCPHLQGLQVASRIVQVLVQLFGAIAQLLHLRFL